MDYAMLVELELERIHRRDGAGSVRMAQVYATMALVQAMERLADRSG